MSFNSIRNYFFTCIFYFNSKSWNCDGLANTGNGPRGNLSGVIIMYVDITCFTDVTLCCQCEAIKIIANGVR